MFLYLSTKFSILQLWNNILKPMRFDLDFWQISKQIYRKPRYRKNVFGGFQGFHSFFRKNTVVFLNQIWYLKTLNQDSIDHEMLFRTLTHFKTSLQETQIYGKCFWKVSTFSSVSQKNGFVYVNQIWHLKVLKQYAIAYKPWFRIL